MAITINREQRDAMHQEVGLDLNGLTDLWTEFNDSNYGFRGRCRPDWARRSCRPRVGL
jgi:hypothetical protein